jgi:hypothetical protein
MAIRPEKSDDVRGGDDNNRVLILLDFLVRLKVDVACCDEDPELSMAEPRNQAGHLPDADRVRGPIAFGLQGEIHQDRPGASPQSQLSNRVPAAIARGAREIEFRDIRQHHACDRGRALLEIVRPSGKELLQGMDNLDFIGIRGKLLNPGAVLD